MEGAASRRNLDGNGKALELEAEGVKYHHREAAS
jgi:hypothetical protein